jgi:hypothetical protein
MKITRIMICQMLLIIHRLPMVRIILRIVKIHYLVPTSNLLALSNDRRQSNPRSKILMDIHKVTPRLTTLNLLKGIRNLLKGIRNLLKEIKKIGANP